MARKVAQLHRKDLINCSADPPSGWRPWAIIETLRRTLFLVHVINLVSARLQKQNPYFYEALDDDLILDMPLPAPAPLWEATREGQWVFTKTASARAPTTGRMVQTARSGVPEDTDNFTRMIIATLPHAEMSSTPAFQSYHEV